MRYRRIFRNCSSRARQGILSSNHSTDRFILPQGCLNRYSGNWAVGLGTRDAQLDKCAAEAHFWGILDNGDAVSNGTVIGKLDQNVEEGDTIVSYYMPLFLFSPIVGYFL